MSSLSVRAAHAAWYAATGPSWRRFADVARDPEADWLRRLGHWIATHADTAYGREIGLAHVHDVASWRARVPVVSWPALAPWVDRAVVGEADVLTPGKVPLFERTSGSSGADKLVPYPDALRREFAAATGAWLHDLHRARPALRRRRAYWSISPVAHAPTVTPGGAPVGLADDGEYLSPAERAALSAILAVPGDVARLPTVAAWRRATVRHLLAAEDLGMISIWSPTFLGRLLDGLAADVLGSGLLDEPGPPLSPRRRRALVEILRRPTFTAQDLWPRLALVSTWADAAAADQLPALRRWAPTVEVQPKGLLATEGVVTVPVYATPEDTVVPGRPAVPVLAVGSHLHELVDVASGEIVAPWEAREGAVYRALLTTGAGFARYDLGDLVRMEGWWRRAPILRFLGRDRTSDLVGEKLAALDVEPALAAALAAALPGAPPPPFLLLTPDARATPGYALLVDLPAPAAAALAAAVDDALCRLHHYAHARALGQLAPVRGVALADGWARFVAVRLAQGARLGDIKPVRFDPRPGLVAALGGDS